MFENIVVDFIFQLAATFIGAFLGYRGGLRISRREQDSDEEQKRTRVIESLLVEINKHEEIFSKKMESPIRGIGFYEIYLSTFSFDGIVASGLYTHLPPESQKIVSRYYEACHLNNDYIQAGILTNNTDKPKLQSIKNQIRYDIKVVLENLKELSARA